jgi:MoaA/NifB/PqqE/SkfB family radical SAM enzyme
MAVRHLFNLFGDRVRSLPILVLYLTDGCNSRCVTCDIWRSPRRNMSSDLFAAVAADCKTLGVRWAVLSGGEAMQHPEWPALAQRLRAEGARVLLLTNGLLIKKQIAEVLASVDEVIVSLDAGTAPTYQAIRGVDGFDLVLEGIALVRAGGLPVTTRTTVQRANYRELPAIIAAAKALDVSSISFLTVDVSNPFAFGPRFSGGAGLPLVASSGLGAPAEHGPPASALERADLEIFAAVLDQIERDHAEDFASGRLAEPPAKLRRMVNYFRAVLNEAPFPRVRCNAPHHSAVVEVDGTLRPCYFLPSMGRVNGRMPLAQALNSDAALALRRAYRAGERPECTCCVCPLYKGPRALLTM